MAKKSAKKVVFDYEVERRRREPRYPMEEYARRAHEWYEIIKPRLKASDHGKFLVVDIESGEYEIHKDDLVASKRIWSRLETPQPFLFRIGYRTAVKFGGRSLRGKL